MKKVRIKKEAAPKGTAQVQGGNAQRGVYNNIKMLLQCNILTIIKVLQQAKCNSVINY